MVDRGEITMAPSGDYPRLNDLRLGDQVRHESEGAPRVLRGASLMALSYGVRLCGASLFKRCFYGTYCARRTSRSCSAGRR